jgi:hypothetical protein
MRVRWLQGLETGGLSLGFLLGSEDAVLKDARREAVAASSGLPFTVVRVGAIQDVPGGSSDLSLQSDAPPTGKIRLVTSSSIPFF